MFTHFSYYFFFLLFLIIILLFQLMFFLTLRLSGFSHGTEEIKGHLFIFFLRFCFFV